LLGERGQRLTKIREKRFDLRQVLPNVAIDRFVVVAVRGARLLDQRMKTILWKQMINILQKAV
jgi:hypothetical protein